MNLSKWLSPSVSLAVFLLTPLGGLRAESDGPREGVVTYVANRDNSQGIAAQTPSSETSSDDEATGNTRNEKKLDHGAKPIREISIDIAPPHADQSPEDVEDVAGKLFQQAGHEEQSFGYSRPWSELNYAWAAPALAYQPLYFEDAHLERYGHHYGVLQPAVSAARFFGRIPALPYMYGATPRRDCHYCLGYYRPGDCAPHFCSRPKLSLKGLLYEGATATGLVFLIP